MKKTSQEPKERIDISRRSFFKTGGAIVGGGALALTPGRKILYGQEEGAIKSQIKEYRTLGRTGFKASDISMGCGEISEANVVRYAYDLGINYFDNAEGYSNGDSEKKIGEALPNINRKKIFITTKLPISDEDTKETVLDRFQQCQIRLNTDYVDALYIHGASSVELLNHEGFHAATAELKAAGKLRFVGVSNHGPGRGRGDSMEKVLVAAAEDGRFDLMLLVYNFLNKDEGKKVLAACKKNNVGTTAMKVQAGRLNIPPFVTIYCAISI